MGESLGNTSLDVAVEFENITVHTAKLLVQQITNTEHKE